MAQAEFQEIKDKVIYEVSVTIAGITTPVLILVSVILARVDPTLLCGGSTSVAFFLLCHLKPLLNWCGFCPLLVHL